tara:strand:- start:202319 stop:202537 length:219 start_codon:yes stop_codon:yes gene_type:complete
MMRLDGNATAGVIQVPKNNPIRNVCRKQLAGFHCEYASLTTNGVCVCVADREGVSASGCSERGENKLLDLGL